MDSTINPQPAQNQTPDSEVISQAGDTLAFSSLKLVNNQWGAPASEKLKCAVFRNGGKGFGWYWDRQDPKLRTGSTLVLPIYPSLRVGGNHREQSSVSYFPVKLGDVKSLTFSLDYNYSQAPTGTYDLAYDMFLLDTNKSGPDAKRKAEVMIWLQGTLGQPPETYNGDFTDGYNNYALYSFTMSDGRLYYAFIMKGKPQMQAHHNVDVKKLLDSVHLDSNWYIPGIEFGNEVVNGSGKLEITQFSINLNGVTIGR